MNELERAELEAENDGFTNECQRALAYSRLSTPRRDASAETAKLVAAGNFVVVESWPVFCRSTDAFLFEESRVAAIFQTYARALEWASQQETDENNFLVYPLVPPPAPQPVLSDYVPF